ncbi:mannosyl-oligosaccharide glucosidase GCS1 [Tanacetum coccineum]
MLLAADCMHSITKQLVNKKESGKAYEETTKLLADFDLLNKKHKMHYDKDYGAYFDCGNHTEKVHLRRKLVEKNGNQPSLELVREVLEKPELRLVHHIGYVRELGEDGVVYGASEHSDNGMITLLATDSVPGLQCINNKSAGKNISTHRLGRMAFVVNLGDMMERWTNYILFSDHNVTDGNSDTFNRRNSDTLFSVGVSDRIPTDSILPTRIHRQPLFVTNPSETTYTDGFQTETAVSKDQFCSSVNSLK